MSNPVRPFQVPSENKSFQRVGEWSSQFNNQWPALLGGVGLAIAIGGLASWNPLIGFGLGLLLVLMVLLLPRPVVIAYIVILAYPFTGGLERGGIIPGLRGAQMMLVLAFFLFVLSKPTRQGKLRLTVLDLAFFYILITGSVLPVLALYFRGGSINTDDVAYGQSPLQLLLGPLQYYLLYRIVVSVISSPKHIEMVLNLLFGASIVVSILGILQKAGVGPVRDFITTYYPTPSVGYQIADVNQRITSTLVNWAQLGAYTCVTLLLALACYTHKHRLNISPRLLMATVLLNMVALVLTGTMVAWIALVIGGVIVFKLSGRVPSPKMIATALVAIVIATIVFLPFIQGRFDEQVGAGASKGILPASIEFRVTAWTQVFLPAIGRNLIFGAGPTPSELNYWPTEESQYLYLLLRGGIPNFLSYWFLMGIGFTTCWRLLKARSPGIEQPVAVGTFAILVAINIMNFTAAYFTGFGATQIIWELLAVVTACEQFKKIGVWETPTKM